MPEYDAASQPLDILISGLYIPELDNGFLSQSLRLGTARRATIESSSVYLEYISIVDVVALAGYASATTNWRNVINCYFQPPITAKSWHSARTQAESKYINPRITGDMRGKTAVVPFNVAVSVLCRLPATKDQAIADIHRIYREQSDILSRFEMKPSLDAALGWG